MIKRWIVRLCLVVILLAVPLGAFSLKQISAAQAAETIPEYGCPATLDGCPIGGGLGCTTLYTAAGANYVATNAANLKTGLAAATSGQVVYIQDGTTITLTTNGQMYNSGAGIGFYVPAGVILAGGRGNVGVTAGIIQVASGFRDNDWCYLIQCGTGADVRGLTLYGNQDTALTGYTWSGIMAGVDTEVYNNEIHGFGYAAISAMPDITNVWVHHNYIHHCRGAGHGYGVEVAAVTGVLSHDDDFHLASALVEGNIFDYCRHTVADQSGRGSYTFRYNYLMANAAYEAQCDAHGQNDDPGGSPDTMAMVGGQYVYCAGEHVEIYNNTSVCAGSNGFVGARGWPYDSDTISVHNNWLKITDGSEGIIQYLFRIPAYSGVTVVDYGGVVSGGTFVQMEAHDNWYGTTAPPSTNRAPVLNAVGNKAVVELATLAFAISATDPDGDTLTYSASNLPVGATFDPATRTFSWTPADTQAGVYANTRFQVSDGSLSDTEDITITVSDRNQADINSDGAVNALDMIRVGQHWNETGTAGWILEDINKDGTVNVLDATLIGQHWTG